MRADLKPARDGRVRVDVVTAQRVIGSDEVALKDYELVVTVGLAGGQGNGARENARCPRRRRRCAC